MKLISSAVLGVLLAAAAHSHAGIMIELSDYSLLPNTIGQEIQVTYSNDGSTVGVSGMSAGVLISGTSGPIFTGAAAGPSSPFTGITPDVGLTTGPTPPANKGISVTFLVPGAGGPPFATRDVPPGTSLNLFKLIISTEGVFGGEFDLTGGSASFNDANGSVVPDVSIGSGTLTVVPEPTHIALAIFGGMMGITGGLRWWRNRRQA